MDNLTQHELDSLLQHSLPALIVRGRLTELDARRLHLSQAEGDFLRGEPLTFIVVDAAGVVRFQHNSSPADPFAAHLLGSCEQQLLHERRMVLQPVVAGFDPPAPLPPTARTDLPSPLTTMTLPVSDPRLVPDVWLSRKEVAHKARIRIQAVPGFAQKNRFTTRMAPHGNVKEYAAPIGFVWPTPAN